MHLIADRSPKDGTKPLGQNHGLHQVNGVAWLSSFWLAGVRPCLRSMCFRCVPPTNPSGPRGVNIASMRSLSNCSFGLGQSNHGTTRLHVRSGSGTELNSGTIDMKLCHETNMCINIHFNSFHAVSPVFNHFCDEPSHVPREVERPEL